MPIPIPIPYGMTYTADASGSAWKLVTCDHCQKRYAYELTRFAEGSGFSPLFLNPAGAQEDACKNALADVQRKLERQFNQVPCPHCGNYQEYMVSKIRWEKLKRGELGCGVALLVPAALLFALYYLISLNQTYSNTIIWAMRVFLWSSLLVAFVGLFVGCLGIVFSYRHDPNNSNERDYRLKEAKDRTVFGEALEKMLSEALQKTDANAKPSS